MPRRTAFAALAFTLAGTTPSWADAPAVVASIKPVHALVAGVMAGVGEPALLLTGAASPHAYGLKPSGARQLQDADLIFWIGPGLETFLIKALSSIPSGATTVALAESARVQLLPARAGGVWEAHAHAQQEDEHDEHGEDHEAHADDHEAHADDREAHANQHDDGGSRSDPHLWLDPENAVAMVDAIEGALAQADPAHAATYQANAERLGEDLRALDQELGRRLAPVDDAPFVVFHDAYQYFERHYGLNAAGSITISPERRPGARRLGEIQDRLAQVGAVCVFSEPQFEPALVATVVQGTGARTGTLDPLGAALEPGPELYPTLLENLARSLLDCLGGDRS